MPRTFNQNRILVSTSFSRIKNRFLSVNFRDAVFNQSEFFLVPRPLPGTYRTKKWQFALRYRTRLIIIVKYQLISSFRSSLSFIYSLLLQFIF